MTHFTGLLIRYNEIGLKGQNRHMFEKKLIDNIESKLRSFYPLIFIRYYGRILILKSRSSKNQRIHFSNSERGRLLELIGQPLVFSNEEIQEVSTHLKRVSGIATFSPCLMLLPNQDLKTLTLFSKEMFTHTILEHLQNKTLPPIIEFSCRSKRSNKSYPHTSIEIDQSIGSELVKTYCDLKTTHSTLPEIKINLSDPNTLFGIEIREEGIFLFSSKEKGPGGLPIGSLGKTLCLLSGGIDSPVAAYLTMRRGCQVDFIYFDSYPYTTKETQEKVKELHRILDIYQNPSTLWMVPFTEIQKEIRDFCNEEMRTVLYRRFMMKISAIHAKRIEAKALITGESIGQVASQTLENLEVTNEAAGMLVLRPLCSMDKGSIIDISKEIGSFETSIQPFPDCCTVFQPSRPATRGKLATAYKEESKLKDEEGLIQKALDSMVTL